MVRNSSILVGGSSSLVVQIKLDLEVLVFVERGKPENLVKNLWRKVRTNNKLNPPETASTGIEPGSQRWKVIAFTLCHL